VYSSPYPDRWEQIAFGLIGSASCLTLAILRGVLFNVRPSVWTVAALFGAAGFASLAVVSPERRDRFLRAEAVGAVAGPVFLVEILKHRIHAGASVTIPLLAFAGGWLAAIALANARDAYRRRVALRDRLASAGGFDDPLVAQELARYLSNKPEVAGQRTAAWSVRMANAFKREVRGLATAKALRRFAAALDQAIVDWGPPPQAPALRPYSEASRAAALAARDEYLAAAADLEHGMTFHWRERFAPAHRELNERGREWLYAVRLLAKAHDVRLPRWFCQLECRYAKASS
jgi:hypothetical protein